MNVRAAKMNADRGRRFPLDGEHFILTSQTGMLLDRNSGNQLSPEIVMFRKNSRSSLAAVAAACTVLLPAASAFASQGPGGGLGTASNLTQVAMAVIVYGVSALIVGTGLIGALRRH
jgi:hypothetical protein